MVEELYLLKEIQSLLFITLTYKKFVENFDADNLILILMNWRRAEYIDLCTVDGEYRAQSRV